MSHVNYDLIVFFFGAIVWVIRGILKGIKQIKRPAVPIQRPGLEPLPSQALPAQTLPARAVPLVSAPATTRSFRRQEQAAAASESAALDAPLSSPAPPSVRQNGLFSGTDDLVRAIILQEVLGPPLSRRTPPPAPSPKSPR